MDQSERTLGPRRNIGLLDTDLPSRTPEAKLWEAVLLRYARDLSCLAHGPAARVWFLDAADDVGSFVYVAAVLGLEPSAVLHRLRAGCVLGSFDGTIRTRVHQLKLIGRQAGAPTRLLSRPGRGHQGERRHASCDLVA